MGFNICAIALVALLCIHISYAYKHDKITIDKDGREQFLIETFGFVAGGKMSIKITDWKIEGKNVDDYATIAKDNKMYFLVRRTNIDPSEFLEEVDCTGNVVDKEDTFQYPIPTSAALDFPEITVVSGEEGFYSLYFINCLRSGAPVSFHLSLEQYNIDADGAKDYLPIGLSPIPTIYGLLSIIYVIMFFVWIFGYMRGRGNILNKVHYLMTVLVFLKFLSLLFYAIEQHYVKIDGRPNGWDIAYYIFAALKTGFFFVIITLIGTGWSFFKPFLSEKDKKIIMVVIPLQILDNIAMIIVGETDPGSFGLLTWKDIFRLVDIICCGAVLIPIIWSIKHLREASQTDGKAARNLQKLRLFRQFYLIVVSYIYFTRIIIYLLDATLQYYLTWMGDVFTELATLIFFAVVGYKFRPINGNPYFNLEEDDAARSEEMRTTVEED